MTLAGAFAELKIEKKNRTVVLRELQQLNTERITAGIHASDGNQRVDKNGFRLIDVAVQNEFGNSWKMPRTVRFKKNGKWWCIKKGTLIVIPATRFVGRIIQDPIEKRNLVDRFRSEMHILLKYGENGRYYKASDVVRSMGVYMKKAIQLGITDKIFKPNTNLTIAMKGFDHRLFEHGTLLKAIKYRSKKAKVTG